MAVKKIKTPPPSFSFRNPDAKHVSFLLGLVDQSTQLLSALDGRDHDPPGEVRGGPFNSTHSQCDNEHHTYRIQAIDEYQASRSG